MSRKWFGTDGVRGIANKKLTPELACSLGLGTGRWLAETGLPMMAVIGRDTRQSGTMLGAAFSSGLCSTGVDVADLGVAPTPTVSFTARHGEYGIGIVLSASHNPAPDNGIKLIGHDGAKLPDEVEERIEMLAEGPWEERPIGGGVGAIRNSVAEVAAYEDFLVSLLPERLDGVRIAVDCSHGAAYEIAPRVLRRLGAEVAAMGVAPDGININEEGGATKPETIQAFTVSQGASIGVAFDGDADRAVFSDEHGRLINGDRTISLWAEYWRSRGRLGKPVVVGTVMSNTGAEKYLEASGVKFERAQVGDKYVSQRMRDLNATIGGEQSGHIIFSQHGPTGDGLATMLEVLRVMRCSSQASSKFVDSYEPWPQLLINVTVAKRDGWSDAPRVREAIARSEGDLIGKGRLNVRASGTQPMIRVMVEADSYELRDHVAESVLAAMQQDLGGEIYSRVDLTHALGD